MACVYLMLVSATTTNVGNAGAETNEPPVSSRPANNVANQKLNFFEHLIFRVTHRKFQKTDKTDADKLARKSQAWGILAISTIALVWVFPPILLFNLVAAIIALSAGRRALKANTKMEDKARLGKGLGSGVLIAASILTVIFIILAATFSLD